MGRRTWDLDLHAFAHAERVLECRRRRCCDGRETVAGVVSAAPVGVV